MLYLIDGYNVVKRDPSLRGMSLQEQREALERHLRLHAREVLGKGSYLVIWDGKGGEGVVRPSMTGRVKYTRMDTADDAIVAKVRSLDPRDQVTVFTSDNELANRCRSSALC